MTDRIAIIRDGAIQTVVLADLDAWTPPAGSTALPESDALAQGIPRAVPPMTEADAVAALATALLAIFARMSPAQRGRTYPARAGIRLALSEGDLAAAREIVLSIPTRDEAEDQIRADMLALFPS